jgi:DNA-binding Xre family transcriptional regulator
MSKEETEFNYISPNREESRLRTLAKEVGIYSISELSRKTELSLPTLYKIERGELDDTLYGTLKKVAEILHCSISDLEDEPKQRRDDKC